MPKTGVLGYRDVTQILVWNRSVWDGVHTRTPHKQLLSAPFTHIY